MWIAHCLVMFVVLSLGMSLVAYPPPPAALSEFWPYAVAV